MDLNRPILQILADGRFHSGQALAAALGVSRTAVWKRIATLQQMGLDVFAVRGRGYRLASPAEPIDADAIREALPADARRLAASIEVLFTTDSTNQHLLDRTAVHGKVVLAEFQHAGRGRRGNRWLSPFGAGVCLSIGWHFSAAPDSLVQMSLLAGAGVARALAACGCERIGLKWPNDLVCGDRKLGGILVETRGQAAGPVDIIVGIGLNVRLPPNARTAIDQPVTDLAENFRDLPPRNRIAAALIAELARMLSAAGTGIWDQYMNEWRSRDAVRGRAVRLRLPDREVSGVAEGIDASGLLLLRVDGAVRRFSSGDISLRVTS
jgi:BirA family biotin operon repressor/biotin-[acetyl-CoA-carboxylase] ligase